MQREVISRIVNVGENVDAAIVETSKKSADGQIQLATALKNISEASAVNFQDVFAKYKETKDNIKILQNSLILHINSVTDNIKEQNERQATAIGNTIDSVNRLSETQFAKTLVEIKGLKDLLETNAETGLKYTNDLKETQRKLSDTLHLVKNELEKGAEGNQKILNDKLENISLAITDGQKMADSNFVNLTNKMKGCFEANKQDIRGIEKSQNIILQENKQNFDKIKQNTQEKIAEQNTLVKDTIKNVIAVGASVGLLKKELTETIGRVKTEVVKTVNDSTNTLNGNISERFENVYDDIENNQNVIVNAFAESMDAKSQIAEMLTNVKNNFNEQKLMIDGVEKVLRDVEDKIDEQGVQVDNVEKVLKHNIGNFEPHLRTETFEDKKENTILINTLKDNLLQYSELRDNNKISFVSFYEDGKIISSKSFDENGKVVAENKFYDNGELKERKTYYVKNGKTEVEVEKF